MELVKVIILEFQTKSEAERCLAFINQLAINYWQDLGFTVTNNKLIGKNLATGENEPNKATTKSWSIIKESPDNTFYIDSLTGTKFEYKYINDVPVKVVDLLAQEGFTFIEKDFPQEWIEDSISNI